MAAARLWWLLRHAGMTSVAMLDGGLGAWVAASYPVETGPGVLTAPGNAEINFGQMPVISIKDAAEWSSHGVLLDARAAERYRGEVEPIDPKAGHIPGALSSPTAGNLASSKQFLPADELLARFEDLGVRPESAVAVYCGSGVTAAHQIAALEIAGIKAALFPGSWSSWSQHAELPVATGTE